MAKGKYHEWITEEGLIKIEGWARGGLTDEQIAHNMGICRDTLIQWKKQYYEIAEALKNGKEVVDLKVENALYDNFFLSSKVKSLFFNLSITIS